MPPGKVHRGLGDDCAALTAGPRRTGKAFLIGAAAFRSRVQNPQRIPPRPPGEPNFTHSLTSLFTRFRQPFLLQAIIGQNSASAMAKQILPFLRLRATQRLLLTFAATVVVPGALLAFFGLRVLIQERRLANQEIRDRLGALAESAARRLEQEFSDWQQAVDQLAQSREANPALWPARVRAAVQEPGSGVVLLGERKRPRAHPGGQLLYTLSQGREQIVSRQQLLLALAQAESLELRGKNYEQAAALYRGLLASARPAERGAVLYRLARTYKKSGRNGEALKTYHLVLNAPQAWVGSLPSDLLALYEISLLEQAPRRFDTAIQLYRNLVSGYWQVEKSSYSFYSQAALDLLPQSQEVAQLVQTENRKLVLSVAAERFLEDPRRLIYSQESFYLGFWRSEPFGAVLLAEPFLRSHLWPAAFSIAGGQDFRWTVLGPGHRALFGESASDRDLLGTHTLQIAEATLQLQVWPTNPDALYREADLRHKFYLGILAIVVALLVFGSYFSVRILKTELAVAQMKSDFVSTVSHEFRSPLTGINQLGEMLRDERVKDEPTRRQYYEMIVSETKRLRRLVENVLDLSRMEEGRKQYQFERFETSSWLQQLADDFRDEVAPARFSVEVSVPENLPVLVGDREALTRAVHNLLDNAVKYSKDSKAVWLDATASDGLLSISVRDRGVGIRDEDKEHIFERFYRGRSELRQKVKGVGLGLNLVQHIVMAHGGSVDFESKEGEGSTFTIRLKVGKETDGEHPAGGR